MQRLSILIILLAATVLAGCGFQLRKEAQIQFAQAFVEAPDASPLAKVLRQELAAQGKLAAQAQGAPVRIKLQDEMRSKDILSLSGGGKVREYRLSYKAELRIVDAQGVELLAPIQLQQVREMSYDDALALAKEVEEAALYRAMEQDSVRQAMRRLSYLKP